MILNNSSLIIILPNLKKNNKKDVVDVEFEDEEDVRKSKKRGTIDAFVTNWN